MNENALKDSYNQFSSTGYNGTLDDYKELLSSNQDALNDAHSLFKASGYNKSVEDFSSLLGVKKKKSTLEESSRDSEEVVEPLQESGTEIKEQLSDKIGVRREGESVDEYKIRAEDVREDIIKQSKIDKKGQDLIKEIDAEKVIEVENTEPEDSDIILKTQVDKLKDIQRQIEQTNQFVDQDNQTPDLIQDNTFVTVGDNTFNPKENPEFKVLYKEKGLTFEKARKAFKKNYLEDNSDINEKLYSDNPKDVEEANEKIYRAFSENKDIGYAAKEKLKGKDADLIEFDDEGYSFNPSALENMYNAFRQGMDDRDFSISMAKELSMAEPDEAKKILELEYERAIEGAEDIQEPTSGLVSREGIANMAGSQALPIVQTTLISMIPLVGKPASIMYSGADAAATSYGAAYRSVYIQARGEGFDKEKAYEIASKEAKVQGVTGFIEGVAGATTGKLATKAGKYTSKFSSKLLKPLVQKAAEGASDMGLDASTAAVGQIVNNWSSRSEGLKTGLFDGVEEEVLGEVIFSSGMKVPATVKTISQFKTYVNQLPPIEQQKVFNNIVDSKGAIDNKIIQDRTTTYLNLKKLEATQNEDTELSSMIESNPKEVLEVERTRMETVKSALTSDNAKEEISKNIDALDLMIKNFPEETVESEVEIKTEDPKIVKEVKKTEAVKEESVTEEVAPEISDEEKNISEFTSEERDEAHRQRNELLEEHPKISNKQQIIHDNWERVKSSDYDHYGDANVRKGDPALRSKMNLLFFGKDSKSIDHQAEVLSQDYGIEITEQDIVDYINDRVSDGDKFKTPKAEKVKKSDPKEMIEDDFDFKLSEDVDGWMTDNDDSESWEDGNVFNHSKEGSIVEWKGEKMPEKQLKDAIAEHNKSKDIDKSLSIIEDTDWFKELPSDSQKAFRNDFKKSLGIKADKDVAKVLIDEINELKKEKRYRIAEKEYGETSTDELLKLKDSHPTKKGVSYNKIVTEIDRRNSKDERNYSNFSITDINSLIKAKSESRTKLNPFIRKRERTLLKEKIKTISTSLKRGEKIGKDQLRGIQSDLNTYVKEVLTELPISAAKQTQIRNIVKNLSDNNYNKAIERIDNMVSHAEGIDRQKTIKSIKDLLKPKKSILRKKGTRWVAKVPIDVQNYIKNFDASSLEGMSRDEINTLHESLKGTLKEGKAITKAIEKEIKKQKSINKANSMMTFFKGVTKEASGLEDIISTMDENASSSVVLNGQLITSKSGLEAFVKDNPNVSLENVKVYKNKTAKFQKETKNQSIYDLLKDIISPFSSSKNLMNNAIDLGKAGTDGLRVAQKIAKEALANEVELRAEASSILKENTNKVNYIFNKGKKFTGLLKDTYARRRLSASPNIDSKSYEAITEKMGEDIVMNNDRLVNWYNINKTKDGKESLSNQGVNMDIVSDYIESTPDLKEFADYLMSDFYTNLKDRYEPVYKHLTGQEFDGDVYYPSGKISPKEDFSAAESIVNSDGSVNSQASMKSIAGSLNEKVKNKAKIDLTKGAFDVSVEYVKSMERSRIFIPYAEMIDDVFNKQSIPEIINTIGADNYKNLIDHISTVITGVSPRKASKMDSKAVNILMKVKILASLGGKFASIPKQLASGARFIGEGDVTPKEFFSAIPINKNERDVVSKTITSSHVVDRFSGMSYDIESGKIADSGSASLAGEVFSKASKIAMLPVSIGDIGGVLGGGIPYTIAAYRQEVAKGLDHDQALKNALARFEEVSEKTQQSSLASQVSHIQRDNVGRMFSMYTTSQKQGVNQIITAAKELKYDKDLSPKKKLEKVGTIMKYATENMIFASIANGLLYSLFKSEVEGEDEDIKKGLYDTFMDNIQSLSSGAGYSGFIANTVISGARGDDWKNQLAIMQEILNVSKGAELLIMGDLFDGITDKEAKQLLKTLPIDGIVSQAMDLKKAAKGDKNIVEAIMGYKTKEEKKGFKPKEDKVYKAIFGKPYYYNDLSKFNQKKYDKDNTPKRLEAKAKIAKKKKELEDKKKKALKNRVRN